MSVRKLTHHNFRSLFNITTYYNTIISTNISGGVGVWPPPHGRLCRTLPGGERVRRVGRKCATPRRDPLQPRRRNGATTYIPDSSVFINIRLPSQIHPLLFSFKVLPPWAFLSTDWLTDSIVVVVVVVVVERAMFSVTCWVKWAGCNGCPLFCCSSRMTPGGPSRRPAVPRKWGRGTRSTRFSNFWLWWVLHI